MSARNNGGSAFPSKFSLGTDGYGNEAFGIEQGMTLRDWFAGQALASWPVTDHSTAEELAAKCYGLADAFIAQRQKGGA